MIATIVAAAVYALVALLPNGNIGTYKDKFETQEACEAKVVELKVEYPAITEMSCVKESK